MISVYISFSYIITVPIPSKKFKKAKKVNIKKSSTTKLTVKKLKKKKKYYVRMRSYKMVNGKKVYSSWSKTKTVKTK